MKLSREIAVTPKPLSCCCFDRLHLSVSRSCVARKSPSSAGQDQSSLDCSSGWKPETMPCGKASRSCRCRPFSLPANTRRQSSRLSTKWTWRTGTPCLSGIILPAIARSYFLLALGIDHCRMLAHRAVLNGTCTTAQVYLRLPSVLTGDALLAPVQEAICNR